ncbi:hypothetical protein ABZZ36_32330 [Actinacidiphila glaucinigra]|uniref:hypothetical protein n=1 Tax=Actinacidiphila glaucinigra TaxID=235986 RepID=UPI0033A34D69
MSTSTAQLLDLTARAAGTTDPGALLEMLQAGHAHWCAGVAELRAHLTQRCAAMSDQEVAETCTRADVPWEPDTTREEAVAHLAFVEWDRSPAAMAYAELATRAAELGMCLAPG